MHRNSDEILTDYLCKCDPEVLSIVLQMMDADWLQGKQTTERFHDPKMIKSLATVERLELVEDTVTRYKYIASNDLAYYTRKIMKKEPGVTYVEILRDVAKLLNESSKLGVVGKALKNLGISGKKPFEVPKIGTVEMYEELIVEMVLSLQVSKMNPVELGECLKRTGMHEKDITALLSDSASKMKGGILLLLAKQLGKKQVKAMVLEGMSQLVEINILKHGADYVVHSLAKNVAQKTIMTFATGLTSAWLAYDLVSTITAPANRIVRRVTTYIAVMRYYDRKAKPQARPSYFGKISNFLSRIFRKGMEKR